MPGSLSAPPALTPTKPAARVADPCVAVIFGASGDLATRMLLPSFYTLRKAGLLPDAFAIVGTSIVPLDQEGFRKLVRDSICEHEENNFDPAVCDWVIERLSYVSGDALAARCYEDLSNMLGEADRKWKTPGAYLYYLATAPQMVQPVVKHLSDSGMMRQEGGKWRRIVVEKPFGTSLDSARELNRQLLSLIEENQIYRIDHYLGKETVQNILVLRFSNGIFEPVWNRRYVDHVQITVAETLGVEHRGSYYDRSGALRDMVPSHLVQLLSLTAMEPPTSFRADALHDEQAKLLRSVQPFTPDDAQARSVRGQYDAGEIDGQPVPAYRSEPDVACDSKTETFAAVKFGIDNWRWAGVPFYVRTGKRLAKHTSEIAIQFRQAPMMLFRETAVERLMPNVLVINILPDEGISLGFAVKVPGPTVHIQPVNMDFHYADYFGKDVSTGYETLLYDCMIGDATLFRRADMVEAGWAVVQPILDVWRDRAPQSFPNYRAGTWGPKDALDLIERDERRWREQ